MRDSSKVLPFSLKFTFVHILVIHRTKSSEINVDASLRLYVNRVRYFVWHSFLHHSFSNSLFLYFSFSISIPSLQIFPFFLLHLSNSYLLLFLLTFTSIYFILSLFFYLAYSWLSFILPFSYFILPFSFFYPTLIVLLSFPSLSFILSFSLPFYLNLFPLKG